ncbi:MAG TPA: hypothetical protein VE172_16240 [Stackebrandtia sp.]|uniref:hypothetical protein n=1 Tax=Stackebrandtia sp. TaxID=2023065 RepID=UPI002D40EA26|nr:hypothetical protein [Stackebrandtia sp.]HZE40352.1 hypothetical protein [Stackebrandtia sp.]
MALSRVRNAAVVIAAVTVLFVGGAASPAQAAPSGATSAGIMFGTVSSEGADVTVGDTTYATGKLHGIVEVEKPLVGPLRANFRLSSEDDSGPLGDVVVTAVDHSGAIPDPVSLTDLTEAVSVKVEKLPDGESTDGPVTLRTSEKLATFTTKDATAFPLVNETYRLRNPVDLYTDDDSTAAGTLENLEGTINQTAQLD